METGGFMHYRNAGVVFQHCDTCHKQAADTILNIQE